MVGLTDEMLSDRELTKEIQKEPKHEDSHEPIARMLKTFPHLLKVELGDHQSEQY